MTIPMLYSKLHRATVTGADLHYEGSIAIDPKLIAAAKLRPLQQVEIYNINNGERFSTYIIPAPPGSGVISLNGAAARKAHVGDLLIICTYAPMTENEVVAHKPKVVLLGAGNRIESVRKF